MPEEKSTSDEEFFKKRYRESEWTKGKEEIGSIRILMSSEEHSPKHHKFRL